MLLIRDMCCLLKLQLFGDFLLNCSLWLRATERVARKEVAVTPSDILPVIMAHCGLASLQIKLGVRGK